MPSGPSCAFASPDRLRRVLLLAACGIMLCTPFTSSVANVCVVVGAIVWIASCFLPGSSWPSRRPPLFSEWVWIFVAGALSLINTTYPMESLRGLLKLGKAFLIFAVAAEAARVEEGPRWFVQAVWLAITLTAADGIWQYVAGQDPLRGIPNHIALGSFKRITGGFLDPNSLGIFFGLTWPLCYLWARSPGSVLRRSAAWSGVLLGALALFFTFSRGAILGWLAGVALLVAVRRDRLLVGLACAGLAVAWWSLPRAALDWVAHVPSPLVALTNEDRLQMWQAAWRMIRAHPFIGVGIGTFSQRYAEFKLPQDPLMASYAHNTYLQLWAVVGLNGLLAFLALCWRGWRLWRTSRPVDATRAMTGIGCMAGALAFLTSGLLESNLSFSKLSMLFWLISGFAMGIATAPTTAPAEPSD